MKRQLIVIVFLLVYAAIFMALQGCGAPYCHEEPHFTTRQDIAVCTEVALAEEFNPAFVSDLVDIVWQTPKYADLKPNSIYFAQDLFSYKGEPAMGLYVGGMISIANQYPCTYHALAHEFGHLYLDLKTGDADPGHTNEIFVNEPGQIVYDTALRLIDYCHQQGD